jgi:hypothetical protein
MADWFKANLIHLRNEECGFTEENTREVEYCVSYRPLLELTTVILDKSRSI